MTRINLDALGGCGRQAARLLAAVALAAVLALTALSPLGAEDPVVVIDSRRDFQVQFDHDRKTAWLSLPYAATVRVALFAWTDRAHGWGGPVTPRWTNCELAGGFTYSVPQVAVCFVTLELQANSPQGFRSTHKMTKFELWE